MFVYTVIYNKPYGLDKSYYIRHFTSEEKITLEQYAMLSRLKQTVTVDLQCWGEIKSFDTKILCQDNPAPKTKFYFDYDIKIPQNDLSEYLDFVNKTVEFERSRPAFEFNKKDMPEVYDSMTYNIRDISSSEIVGWEESNPFRSSYEDSCTTEYLAMATGKWIDGVRDIMPTTDVPQVLFACNFFSEACINFLPIWQNLAKTPNIEFYLLPSTSEYRITGLSDEFITPLLFWRTGSEWTPYTGDMTLKGLIPFMTKLKNHEATIIYELSNGVIVEHTDDFPVEYIGTNIFPDLTVVATLTLQRNILTLEGISSGRIQLNEAQINAIKGIFTTGMFSLEHCFKMWESKKHISSVHACKGIGQSKLSDTTQMKMDWLRFLPEKSETALPEQLEISVIKIIKNFEKSIDAN